MNTRARVRREHGTWADFLCGVKRSGVRVHEIFNEELFERKLRQLASGYKKRFGDLLKYDVEEEIARFKEYRPKLASYVVDAVQYMKQAQDRNYKILIEGANALMLDIDYGKRPRISTTRRLANALMQVHIPTSPAATPVSAVSSLDWPSTLRSSSKVHRPIWSRATP